MSPLTGLKMISFQFYKYIAPPALRKKQPPSPIERSARRASEAQARSKAAAFPFRNEGGIRAHRQLQRRRRGIFAENALQTIFSSVGAAYFDVAPDVAENDFISILQICRADGAAEETTTFAKAGICEVNESIF